MLGLTTSVSITCIRRRNSLTLPDMELSDPDIVILRTCKPRVMHVPFRLLYCHARTAPTQAYLLSEKKEGQKCGRIIFRSTISVSVSPAPRLLGGLWRSNQTRECATDQVQLRLYEQAYVLRRRKTKLSQISVHSHGHTSDVCVVGFRLHPSARFSRTTVRRPRHCPRLVHESRPLRHTASIPNHTNSSKS